jgi:glutamine cyclotransferase
MLDIITREYKGKMLLTDEFGRYLYKVSELEIARDPRDSINYLWGCIWAKNEIVKINLTTGGVVRRYDLGLLE